MNPNKPPTILPVLRSKSRAKQSYDRLSTYYDFLASSEWPCIREGLTLLAAKSGEHILEVGYGTGRALVQLARAVGQHGRVDGIDISPGMRAKALGKLAHHGLQQRCRLEIGDAAHLPYPDNHFDAVFIAFTLELFDTPEIPKLLSQIARVLKIDGRLLLVSLSKIRGSSMPVRIYEFFHSLMPNYIDCRPILAQSAIAEAGFEIQEAEVKSMWFLPVEIVLASSARQ